MAPAEGLQRLLDLCDEIRVLRQKIRDPQLKAETVVRLQAKSRERLESLASELADCRRDGPLSRLTRGLSADHFLILAHLLRRHLRSASPFMEGRVLLAAVFDTSYELLRGLDHLQPEGKLRSLGLILAESEDDVANSGDLLLCKFRLSDEVVMAFLEELGLKSTRPAVEPEGYASQVEYLIDLKIWHNLHRARARRLFAAETWWRLRGGAHDRSARAVDRRIRRATARIEQRLAKTQGAARFPIVALVDEAGLHPAEFLIVLNLLFRELIDGNPYADVVQLIQLVSASEAELVANRQLFDEKAPLRRSEIIELDEMLEGRELTSECHLANWVVERVLGSDAKVGPIDADERLNFHLYLKRLGSSNFLNDL
jgi:hypothetical protein